MTSPNATVKRPTVFMLNLLRWRYGIATARNVARQSGVGKPRLLTFSAQHLPEIGKAHGHDSRIIELDPIRLLMSKNTKSHGDTVVEPAVDQARERPRGSLDNETVRLLRGVHSDRVQVVHQSFDAIRFLHPELAGVAHRGRALRTRREDCEGGDFVDHSRDDRATDLCAA